MTSSYAQIIGGKCPRDRGKSNHRREVPTRPWEVQAPDRTVHRSWVTSRAAVHLRPYRPEADARTHSRLLKPAAMSRRVAPTLGVGSIGTIRASRTDYSG